MVEFDNEEEREYFHNIIMIGEVARSTLLKIFDKIGGSETITRDEIFAMQKDAIAELKLEANKLEEEERDNIQNETNKTETQDTNKQEE